MDKELTENQKRYLEIYRRNKKGEGTYDVLCKQEGITVSSFYSYTSALKQKGVDIETLLPDEAPKKKRGTYKIKHKAIVPTTIQVQHADRPMVFLMGKPTDINQALSSLASIWSN